MSYCSIYDYLVAKDKKLAAAIDQGCTKGSLSSRGFAGITFLIPEDKAVLDKIVKGLPSLEPGKSEAALDLLHRHILVDYFPTAESLLAAGNDVPNRLKKAVDVKKGSKAGTVEFEGGAVATPIPAAKFGVPRRKNLAVWKLSGQIAEGSRDARAFRRNERKAAQTVKGGADSANRRIVSNQLECMWAAWRGRGGSNDASGPYCVYAEALLHCLHDNYKSTYDTLAPLVDPNPMATWYLLAEPYRSGGGFLVSQIAFNKVFNEWGGIKVASDMPDGAYIRKAIADGAARIDGAKAKAAVEAVRATLDADNYNKRAPTGIRGAYAAFASGTVDGRDIGYPTDTLKAIGGRKQAQDELRYIVANLSIPAGGGEEMARNELGAFVHKLAENGVGEKPVLSAPEQMKYLVPNAAIETMMDFVRSSAFLYLA